MRDVVYNRYAMLISFFHTAFHAEEYFYGVGNVSRSYPYFFCHSETAGNIFCVIGAEKRTFYLVFFSVIINVEFNAVF